FFAFSAGTLLAIALTDLLPEDGLRTELRAGHADTVCLLLLLLRLRNSVRQAGGLHRIQAHHDCRPADDGRRRAAVSSRGFAGGFPALSCRSGRAGRRDYCLAGRSESVCSQPWTAAYG